MRACCSRHELNYYFWKKRSSGQCIEIKVMKMTQINLLFTQMMTHKLNTSRWFNFNQSHRFPQIGQFETNCVEQSWLDFARSFINGFQTCIIQKWYTSNPLIPSSWYTYWSLPNIDVITSMHEARQMATAKMDLKHSYMFTFQ